MIYNYRPLIYLIYIHAIHAVADQNQPKINENYFFIYIKINQHLANFVLEKLLFDYQTQLKHMINHFFIYKYQYNEQKKKSDFASIKYKKQYLFLIYIALIMQRKQYAQLILFKTNYKLILLQLVKFNRNIRKLQIISIVVKRGGSINFKSPLEDDQILINMLQSSMIRNYDPHMQIKLSIRFNLYNLRPFQDLSVFTD
ncbi:hypothetical protein pb186bvf_004981 [Paramecium bursaria]